MHTASLRFWLIVSLVSAARLSAQPLRADSGSEPPSSTVENGAPGCPVQAMKDEASATNTNASPTSQGQRAASRQDSSPPLPSQAPVSGTLTPGQRQRDLFDVARSLFKIKTKPGDEKPKQLEMLVLPIIDQNPTTGFVLGVGATGTYRSKDPNTQISSFDTGIAYSSKSQFLTAATYDFFTRGNRWNLHGDFGYVDSSLPVYGIGAATPNSQADLVDFKLFGFHQTARRQMKPGLYAGLGYHLDLFSGIKDTRAQAGEQTPFQTYGVGAKGSSTSSGISLDLLLERRDNPINATRGVYASMSYKMFPKFLGSDENWQSFYVDARAYPRLPGSRKNVLALWAFGWFTTSGTPPYLELPGLATPFGHAGRGYTQGRYRGKNALYGEAEYRFGISSDGLFGGVVFANLGSVTELDSNRFKYLIPATGIGLRVKFDKNNGSNLRVDYAFGKAGSNGLYLGINEAY
ncbi:MAG: surface antigen [Chthonomonadaceae bacterium]|nr:surface antigen [Chthonomonadaceae bacterium]